MSANNDNTTFEIALFPIPHSVAFPGSVFPLHVFEPRYRNMVNHCLDNNLLLGICHTQKVVSPGKSDLPLEEALQSNQATYKPYSIFSAGQCELIKTLDDGRMYLHIPMSARYRAVKELQTLPFNISLCELFEDEAMCSGDLEGVKLTQQKILMRLEAVTSRSPEAQDQLDFEAWRQKDPLEFSFEVFGLLQFEADIQQQILEMQSPVERLHTLLNILNANL